MSGAVGRLVRAVLLVAAGCGLLLPAWGGRVAASPLALVVTTTADDMNDANCTVARCTLRQAINAANANDPGEGGQNAITFAPNVAGAISLTSTLTVAQGIAITGPGANALAISGGGTGQIFTVGTNPGRSFTVRNLTLSLGRGDNGGAIMATNTALTLVGCVFIGNVATNAGAVYAVLGTLDIRDSVFQDNRTGTTAGGQDNGGGGAILAANTRVRVTNTTFARNKATAGAAILYVTTVFPLEVTLTSSTFSGNISSNSDGGTITNSNYSTSVPLVRRSIVSGNTGGDIVGMYADGGGNVIGDDARLDILDANAPGAIATFALLPGSPAIDTGPCPPDPITNATLDTDARGVARPQGSSCDAGAFESRRFVLTNPTGTLQRAFVGAAYADPLAVTVTSGAGEPVNGGVVTFAAPASGPSVAFAAANGCVVAAGGASATCTIRYGRVTAPPMTANGMAGRVNVTAATSGVDTPATFLLGNTPVVEGISPASGGTTGGTAATIRGAGFGTNTGRVRVTFDGADGTVTAVADTAIAVQTPPHAAGSANVVVSVDGVGATMPLAYTYGVIAPAPPTRTPLVLPGTPAPPATRVADATALPTPEARPMRR